MNTSSRKLALVSAISLAMAMGTVSAVAGSAAQDLVEARLEAQIWTTYARSPYLRANDINVSVEQGKATLTGVVEEDVNRDLAKQIALGVDGIKEVDNQIVIKADYVRPAKVSGRSYADMVDDANITTAVKSKLSWNAQTNGMDARVSTMAGKVTLTGAAESQAVKDLAGRLAHNTRGVLAVDNQLEVDGKRAEQAKAAFKEAGNDLADAWITTKVKSTFMYSNNVDGGDITVSTENGMVTLSGQVASGAERALAIELAQNVRGVKGVLSKGLVL